MKSSHQVFTSRSANFGTFDDDSLTDFSRRGDSWRGAAAGSGAGLTHFVEAGHHDATSVGDWRGWGQRGAVRPVPSLAVG